MNSIIPTNIVLNFNLFQEWEIYISLFLALIIIIIYLLLNKLRINYIKNKARQDILMDCKNKYLKMIFDLDTANLSFFYELNYLLRTFLEEYNRFPGITKMTKNEIFAKNIKSTDLKTLLENCEKYEFGNIQKISKDIKLDSKNKALLIIKNI